MQIILNDSFSFFINSSSAFVKAIVLAATKGDWAKACRNFSRLLIRLAIKPVNTQQKKVFQYMHLPLIPTLLSLIEYSF